MTNHGCMAMTLKPQSNRPYGSVQKSQNRKEHIKFGQMWRFCSLFSSIAMVCGASWILAIRSYVNKEYNLEVRRRLRQAIRQKSTELWKNESQILHHDNAPAHALMLVSEFLSKTKLQSCFNHRNQRTGPQLTTSSSKNWRHRWKQSILLRLRR